MGAGALDIRRVGKSVKSWAVPKGSTLSPNAYATKNELRSRESTMLISRRPVNEQMMEVTGNYKSATAVQETRKTAADGNVREK